MRVHRYSSRSIGRPKASTQRVDGGDGRDRRFFGIEEPFHLRDRAGDVPGDETTRPTVERARSGPPIPKRGDAKELHQRPGAAEVRATNAGGVLDDRQLRTAPTTRARRRCTMPSGFTFGSVNSTC